jgi:hypothetical protein
MRRATVLVAQASACLLLDFLNAEYSQAEQAAEKGGILSF